MLLRVRMHEGVIDDVSILTRPGGRVLPSTCRAALRGVSCFNPHPARGPGAASSPTPPTCTRSRSFNPHPARGPGAAGLGGRVRERVDVSILTRPGGRVLPPSPTQPQPARANVSILTRPGGRVLPSATKLQCRRRNRFNPHPARGPGAAARGTLRCAPPRSFNPHPARGPGAAVRNLSDAYDVTVFQSSPGPGAGCCSTETSSIACSSEFQSSPGPGAGCCMHQVVDEVISEIRFQSSPGPGAGVLHRRRNGADAHPRPVSILTRPGGRVLPFVTTIESPTLKPVSILTRPGGRVLLTGGGDGLADASAFQSSPGPGAGCCRSSQAARTTRRTSFNPHPARGPGAAGTGPRRTWRPYRCFNPHPARGPGAAKRSSAAGRCCHGFNPHPARGPGAARPRRHHRRPQRVSILTRPGGRVLPTSSKR